MYSTSKDESLDILDLALLSIVAEGGQEAYGKAIAEALTASTGKTVSKDKAYIMLFRLGARGLVSSRDQENAERATPKGRLRRLYEITPDGLAALGKASESRGRTGTVSRMEGNAAA